MVFVLLTLLTGVAYPLLVTLVGQGLFPHQANGSVIRDTEGKPVGSELIGQPFDEPHYFWGRPSATAPVANNAAASTGSNLGPTNPDLLKAIGDRVEAIRSAHPGPEGPGAGRPGDRVGERPRPAHQPGGGGVPGDARRRRSRRRQCR